MNRTKHQRILEIVSSKRIATQQALAAELARRGIAATQSSISRDIDRLGLTKVNGYYAAPQAALDTRGPITEVDTAGDNLIVVKTEVGLAQPAALTIDRANIDQIVGTVAGDDTILIAVKNAAAQKIALKKLVELFAAPEPRARRSRKRTNQAAARAIWIR
jgi:transcriptional regulator of arginine metabolism